MHLTMTDDIKQDSPGVRIMPPSIFLGCLVLGGLLELILPGEFPFFPGWLRISLGLFAGAVGFTFMMIAHQRFQSAETNVSTNMPADALVVHGAYRYSRNPMYVGGVAIILGLGTALGSLWLTAAAVPLFLYLAFYVIPREEAYMERTFGEQYKNYCLKVRRWL